MTRAFLASCVFVLAACASAPAHAPQGPATPMTAAAAATGPRPLAGLAPQRVIVTPVYALDRGDPMGWAASIDKPREVLRSLDSAIVSAFDARGMRATWFFAPDLEQSYKLNSTYAADPHMLAELPLRGSLEIGHNFGDPLATQLRTMIAMQDGARLVLLPVDVRFEKDGAVEQRAVLKLVLVDARTTEYVWTGEVRSDPATAFGPAVLKSLATHFADLVAAP